MITRRCSNPSCAQTFTPDAAHRFGDTCSAACARAMTPRRRAYTGSRTPNTSQTVIAPRYHSKRGADNRKATE